MTSTAMAKAAASDPTGVAAVIAAFGDAGIPPDEADRVVTFESAWKPEAFNPSTSSVGLLQWTPSTLKAMPGHPSTSTVRAMSRTGQASLVRAFFDPSMGYHRTRPGDSYLWMAATATKWLSAPESTVVYPKGSRAWQLNPGLRPFDGGDITVGRLLRLGDGSEGPSPGKKIGAAGGGALGKSGGGFGALLLLLVVAAALSRR